MSTHFAAAQSNSTPQASRMGVRRLLAKAQRKCANDNPPGTKGSAQSAEAEQVLRAALRHFAIHGLSAANVARAQAEKAFFDGDRETYDWWLGITRTLDRRMAASVSGQSDKASKSTPRLMK